MSGERLNGYAVGYGRPPRHTRFQPGQSGNPSGRPKGAQNFKSLFQKILKEQISLREGAVTKKISKAEAILRGLVIGAMKGDARSVMALFRLAEQTGEFDEDRNGGNNLQIIVRRFGADLDDDDPDGRSFPAISHFNRE